MGCRGAAVPRNAQLRELPQPVGTPAGDAAHARRGVVRPSPQPSEAAAESLAAGHGSPVNAFQRGTRWKRGRPLDERPGSMKDVAADPAPPRLLSLAGNGGEQHPDIQGCALMSPLERAIELARAGASDLWAARRGYTASSLEPAVARAYDLAGHAGRSGMS